MLNRPSDEQPGYGKSLSSAKYWSPWISEALRRHELPDTSLEVPFPGTYPTFVAGDVVVKLFGDAFDGGRTSEVEIAMHELLANHRDIRAPMLVAHGHLYEDPPTWPYLITQRIPGIALRERRATPTMGELGAELGALVRRLHGLTAPAPVRSRDLVPELRRNAPERLRRFGLPPRLVEQVPEFLADADPATLLVHGDITADHVFIEDDRLAAVIDWGDALVADRSYELGAIYLDAFDGDRSLLDAFLDAASWLRDRSFHRRALQGLLEHQFDTVQGMARAVDLDNVQSLEELAERLFE